MNRITLRLSSSTTARLSPRQAGPSTPVEQFLQERGLKLHALDAGGESEEPPRYFEVAVPEELDLEAVLERLRALAGVEAAYVKPPGEAPG